VVVELSVSNEEFQFDIVKEALEDGIGQSKQNKKTPPSCTLRLSRN